MKFVIQYTIILSCLCVLGSISNRGSFEGQRLDEKKIIFRFFVSVGGNSKTNFFYERRDKNVFYEIGETSNNKRLGRLDR